jgi:hypothetical protein
MPTLEYEDDKVEEMYYINKEILEEDGKGEANTITMGDWKGWLKTLSHNMDWEEKIRGQMFIKFC